MFDTWIMLIIGIVGYLMRKLNYPVAPAVLAIVLGPLAERSMRQSLISSQGDITTFVTRPISLTCVILALLLISYPLIQRAMRKRKAAQA
jgi:putative tricarboxylic transport membrane protein